MVDWMKGFEEIEDEISKNMVEHIKHRNQVLRLAREKLLGELEN